MFVFSAIGVSKYATSVERLLAEITTEYRFFAAHGPAQIPFATLPALGSLLDCILASECTSTLSTYGAYQIETFNRNGMSVLVFRKDSV